MAEIAFYDFCAGKHHQCMARARVKSVKVTPQMGIERVEMMKVAPQIGLSL